MAVNLAQKLPESAHVHVYDVFPQAVTTFCNEFPKGRVVSCENAKAVAEKSVYFPQTSLEIWDVHLTI